MLETDLRRDSVPGGEPVEPVELLELFDLERPRGVSKAACVTGLRKTLTAVRSVPPEEGRM